MTCSRYFKFWYTLRAATSGQGRLHFSVFDRRSAMQRFRCLRILSSDPNSFLNPNTSSYYVWPSPCCLSYYPQNLFWNSTTLSPTSFAAVCPVDEIEAAVTLAAVVSHYTYPKQRTKEGRNLLQLSQTQFGSTEYHFMKMVVVLFVVYFGCIWITVCKDVPSYLYGN